MKTLKAVRLFFLSFLMITIFGCSDSQSNKISAEAPTISVKLVDAPGDYDAVNVEIVDVMIKMDDNSDSESGWMSLNAEAGPVNLLDFTGGISKVLVDRFPIPAGTLSQMRLVLGDGNSIVIRNDADEPETFDLKTPSAQQSGLKLKVNTTIEEGFTYDFILDFNVEKSIVRAGNSGNIILKPVLYMSTEVSSGIIEGTVEPTDVPSVVSVLVDDNGTPDNPDDDFVITANTDDTGAFALWGVPAGTYDVVATPLDPESNYSEGSAVGVSVTNGETTTIDMPIALHFKSITGKVTGLTDGVVATVSIMVDGSPVTDETDSTGAYVLEDIPAGTYTMTVSADGYISQDIEVVVEADTQTTVPDILLVM